MRQAILTYKQKNTITRNLESGRVEDILKLS